MTRKSPSTSGKARILEVTSLSELRHAQKRRVEVMDFYAQHYASLAYQRAQIFAELKSAIRGQCSQFKFPAMFRLVRYRWSLEPLSARGSLADPSGGRFNIGDLDESRFPKFPALYLADSADNVSAEVFGESSSKKKGKPSRLESWLVKMESCSIVRVSGDLKSVFDLTRMENLKPYFGLIKTIKFPRYVKRLAKILRLKMPCTVRTTAELYKTLLDPDWRFSPTVFDVPANPQIFGHIAESAGVQGIFYPSVKGNGNCLAVFPRNFVQSDSFVEIVDHAPEHHKVVCRLDNESWKNLI